MRLLPAIDILEGSAVRLTRGDFAQSKVYDADPRAAAAGWVEQGALALHVVDLDGARAGSPVNVGLLRKMTRDVAVPVQYGGGLRTAGAVDGRARSGRVPRRARHRRALRRHFLADVISAHGAGCVLVSLDVRGGKPAVAGWTASASASDARELERLSAAGVEHFVYTDVERDGLLAGPGRRGRKRAAGRRRRHHLLGRRRLAGRPRNLARLALEGVIVGKALYERRFTVAAARAALGD